VFFFSDLIGIVLKSHSYVWLNYLNLNRKFRYRQIFDVFSIDRCQFAWLRVVSQASLMGVPVPAFSTALSFYDGYRTARLPANLLQAQRDYFGAHTFEYEGKPGVFEHVNWTGRGGNVHASTYNA
jgi:6-phosphogluconate dehydrogenase